MFVFGRKVLKLTELVADLRRLLHQQQQMQAQLPELQPSLCRKAMMLRREVMPGSRTSCYMWLRDVLPSQEACHRRMVVALQDQVSVAYIQLQSGSTLCVFPVHVTSLIEPGSAGTALLTNRLAVGCCVAGTKTYDASVACQQVLTQACAIADTLRGHCRRWLPRCQTRLNTQCGPDDPITGFEQVVSFQVGLHKFSAKLLNMTVRA